MWCVGRTLRRVLGWGVLAWVGCWAGGGCVDPASSTAGHTCESTFNCCRGVSAETGVFAEEKGVSKEADSLPSTLTSV